MTTERVQHTLASGGDERCRAEKWDTVTPSLTLSSPTGQQGAREVQQGVCVCVLCLHPSTHLH